jgi:hypothetical protein
MLCKLFQIRTTDSVPVQLAKFFVVADCMVCLDQTLRHRCKAYAQSVHYGSLLGCKKSFRFSFSFAVGLDFLGESDGVGTQ